MNDEIRFRVFDQSAVQVLINYLLAVDRGWELQDVQMAQRGELAPHGESKRRVHLVQLGFEAGLGLYQDSVRARSRGREVVDLGAGDQREGPAGHDQEQSQDAWGLIQDRFQGTYRLQANLGERVEAGSDL